LPWVIDTIAASGQKTGRLVVTQEAPLTNGFASEIAASIQERCFLYLESPIARVCGLDTPYPLCHEKEYFVDHLKVYEAIKASMSY
jgi:2-oxoisovalerate dehydrogenase E1 component beta subunit